MKTTKALVSPLTPTGLAQPAKLAVTERVDLEGNRRPFGTAIQFFLLALSCAVPRLLGALWLPNAFGDAYAYTEQIYRMRQALLSGTFSLANLFGFWLPLYQLLCALISAVLGMTFYVPKFLSALAGAGVCMMVFLLTRSLTGNHRVSLVSFALISFNPYHIFYSSSALTDVPHAFFFLLCAYCCFKSRWIAAAVLAALACLMRIESWTLILLLPLLQFFRERKVSPLACAILPLAPLFWMYISWQAGGSPWKYFEIRNQYIEQSVAAAPYLAHFTLRRIGLDLVRLCYGANGAVLSACLAGSFSVLRGWLRRPNRERLVDDEIVLAFFLSNLVFVAAAYFSGNQPDIWPRYGLIMFATGLPFLAKGVLNTRPAKGSLHHRFLQMTIWGFALQFCIQVADVARITFRTDPHQLSAQFLGRKYLTDHSFKIYCEDGAVRVLSGIPLEQFVDQYDSPSNRMKFFEFLKEKHVRYLVYKELPGSHLGQMIREIRAGKEPITLEKILPRGVETAKDGVEVYRIHDQDLAAKDSRQRNHSGASAYE